MIGFRWDASFSVEIKEVDEQHKKLISLLNGLFEAMQAGQGKSVLTETLDELVDYTKYHFGTEEALMTQYNYPAYLAHKRQHIALAKKALELKSKNDRGEAVITVSVMNFLVDWLKDHIKNSDKKYTELFKRHGVN
jgi:hemerythrin